MVLWFLERCGHGRRFCVLCFSIPRSVYAIDVNLAANLCICKQAMGGRLVFGLALVVFLVFSPKVS